MPIPKETLDHFEEYLSKLAAYEMPDHSVRLIDREWCAVQFLEDHLPDIKEGKIQTIDIPSALEKLHPPDEKPVPGQLSISVHNAEEQDDAFFTSEEKNAIRMELMRNLGARILEG